MAVGIRHYRARDRRRRTAPGRACRCCSGEQAPAARPARHADRAAGAGGAPQRPPGDRRRRARGLRQVDAARALGGDRAATAPSRGCRSTSTTTTPLACSRTPGSRSAGRTRRSARRSTARGSPGAPSAARRWSTPSSARRRRCCSSIDDCHVVRSRESRARPVLPRPAPARLDARRASPVATSPRWARDACARAASCGDPRPRPALHARRGGRELLQSGSGWSSTPPTCTPRRAHRGLARRPVPGGPLAARPSRPAGVRPRVRGRPPPRRRVPARGGAARASRPRCATFLLRTSLLARLSGAALRRDAGAHGSAALLADLERRNQFVIALDDHREWYRYHHLFAEFLRGELALAEPELVPGAAPAARRRGCGRTSSSTWRSGTRRPPARYDEAAAMIVRQRPACGRSTGDRRRSGRGSTCSRTACSRRDPQLAACAAWHGREPRAPTRRRSATACASPSEPDATPVDRRRRARSAPSSCCCGRSCRTVTPAPRCGRRARPSRGRPARRPGDPASRLAPAGLALLQAGHHDEARGPLRAAMRLVDPAGAGAAPRLGSLALLAAAEAHAGDPQRGARARRASLAAHRRARPRRRRRRSATRTWASPMRSRRPASRLGRSATGAARGRAASCCPAPHVTHAYALLVLARALTAQRRGRRRAGDLERAARRDRRRDRRALRAARRGRARQHAERPAAGTRRAAERPRAGRAAPARQRPEPARDRAPQLFVSVNTVKTHVRAVLRKFDVGTRGAAVELAREAGLIGDYAPATTAAPRPAAGRSDGVDGQASSPPQRLVARMPADRGAAGGCRLPRMRSADPHAVRPASTRARRAARRARRPSGAGRRRRRREARPDPSTTTYASSCSLRPLPQRAAHAGLVGEDADAEGAAEGAADATPSGP